MKRKTINVEYETDQLGSFLIQTINGKKTIVWWDVENTGGLDGLLLSPDDLESHTDWLFDFIGMVIDFSDLPKNGEFKNHDEAYNYLVSKFGNIN